MGKIVTPNQAEIDGIHGGKAYGNTAQRLLNNGMNVNSLRTNDTLRKDEWKELDETVVQIATQRLVGVSDLVSRGLVHNIGNGLGTTVLEYEDASNMEDAEVSMDGATQGQEDRVEFDIKSLPLPLTHKNFKINVRVLEASRKLGQSLDTTQAAIASRLVAEKVEDTLFNGLSAYTFGGGTIRGYTDHPNRNTVTLAVQWDASAATGDTVLNDVIAMKQASIDDRHFGPWMLYIPTNYDTKMDEDFKTNSDKTIRQRVREIEGIEDVKVADKLSDDNVVLVELAPETARMVIGLQPTTVEWQTEGGMIFHFKVMSIMVPQIRTDQDLRSGIIHLS